MERKGPAVLILTALVLGMILANLLEPGKNLGLPLPDIGASANLATSKFTLKDFVSHLVPKSFAEAMANNEILQIVVFSMFFGIALAALGEKAKTLVNAIDELSHAMLKITGYVMKLAPLAVLAAMPQVPLRRLEVFAHSVRRGTDQARRKDRDERTTDRP